MVFATKIENAEEHVFVSIGFLQKLVDGLKCKKCEWAGKQKIEMSAPNIFQREIVRRCAKCNYEVSLINSQSIKSVN